MLHQVVRENLETLLSECAGRSHSGRGYPAHVEQEFRRYLACGILSHGFLRVHCPSCKKDELCAFSCKGKAVCPSCVGRRMSESAARLVDERLPDVPYRQWVFSFPVRLRVLLAKDKSLLAEVFALCIKKVFAYHRKRAKRAGVDMVWPKGLAVLFVQRFGSLLTLNPHGHAIVPDGVFGQSSGGEFEFVEFSAPTDQEVEAVGLSIVKGILKLLVRREGAQEPGDDDEAMTQALAEAVLSGATPKSTLGDEPRKPKRRVALIQTELGLFSFHADTHVAQGNRAGLERLLRYCGRPAFAHKRLSLLPSGKVSYKLRKAYFTGQTEVVLEPVAFLRRLAALVPPARQNQIRYYGLLASQASDRPKLLALCEPPDDVEPKVASAEDAGAHLAGEPEPAEEPKATTATRRSWAALLKRVFQNDVLLCPSCGGDRKIIAAITKRDAIVQILDHLDLPSDEFAISPARAPPQTELFNQFPA